LFQIKSGNVHITDPCYDVGVDCAVFYIPTLNGIWLGSVKYSEDGSVSQLLSFHKDYQSNFPDTEISDDNGVDSAQLGIFDSEIYPNGKAIKSYKGYEDLNSFYGRACYMTHSNEDVRGGIVDGRGIVSQTGYGDGAYTSYGNYINFNGVKTLVSIGIVFIDDGDFDNCLKNYLKKEKIKLIVKTKKEKGNVGN